MYKAEINITVGKDEEIETELIINLRPKPYITGQKQLNYAHPMSRGLVSLYLFPLVRSGDYEYDITGNGNPFKTTNLEKYKDKIRLVYNRLLEKSEIELLIRDPICMTQDPPKLPKYNKWCCCRTAHLNYCSCCGNKI